MKVAPLIIGITGGSGSGKSSVANKIKHGVQESLGEDFVTIIAHDDYYKNQDHLSFEERLKTNYDHPFSFDNELFVSDVHQLKSNHTILKPTYDFVQHTRSNNTECIAPTKIIILEGILILEDKRIRDLLDIKVYVQTDDDIRFIRRLQRDVKERGRSLDSVISQYLATVKPMQEEFIEPSKKYADVIIPVGGTNSVAIDLLLAKIYSTLATQNSV